MKKICFVTAARSEYGLLKWIMKEVEKSEEFQLQIVATGGHLLEEQGYTLDQIKEDGFVVDAEVETQLDTISRESIAASMGNMAMAMSHTFSRLRPDYIVVLGDRYELLPICSSAFVMSIPIIHISGGDITEGAIDNGIRNAVTMLATYHFSGTSDSADNIRRMRNSDKNIWAVGEPGLDVFNNECLLDRETLAEDLQLNSNLDWVLLTYHAETRKSLNYNLDTIKSCCDNLKNRPEVQVIATYANTDYGGKQINGYLEEVSKEENSNIKVIPSLGSRRYLSYMKQVRFMIGNSSSGIVEAPCLGIPVINIGDRQKGRHLCSNIIQCDADKRSIKKAIDIVSTSQVDLSDIDYWGDGRTSKRIIQIFREVL